MYIDKERNLLIIEKEKDTPPLRLNKKITGHPFVDILGFNPYKLSGDALLSLHGLVTEAVDEKWLRRGNKAEEIVRLVYERDGHKCTVYDDDYKKANYYTCFPQLRSWGGLIDIELIEEQTLIEVKSKSLDKFPEIAIQGKIPEDEFMQGMFYAFLRGYKKFTMEYIFFDKDTEEEIFQGKKPTTLKNISRFSIESPVDEEKIKECMKKCSQIVNEFRQNLTLPLDTISPKYIQMLKDNGMLPKDDNTNNTNIVELPF